MALGLSAPRGISADLPGTPPFDPQLAQRLKSAWAARAPSYQPRTRHLGPDGSPLYSNRLFLETSPYLLQHAHNPVNWYPWGAEAFDAARRLGRPVLLSVGYSTCHWCHVMEEECFEDLEVARYLNENYIAIKVDREERPDVDAVYMSAVQALTGGGGWPMTVWLAPDRKPFFGGTYFPKAEFLAALRKLKQAYAAEPDRVAAQAAELTKAIEESLRPAPSSDLPQRAVLHAAARIAASQYDPANGGTSGAPKFPSGLPLRLLLRYHRRTGDAGSLEMVSRTLEKMAAGGIHDQAGGGFHRYSTDPRWLVPHFEKMLYDNALLATTYLEAFQATGRREFADVARDILRYIDRDMTSPEGAFYSATDADSLAPNGKREEGWFFTWTLAELEAALGRERARVVEAYYGVTAKGNFHGRNILHTPRPLPEVARELGIPLEKARQIVDESRELLYAGRNKRPRPLRDEKILTSWNGLAISALAQASLALGDDRYAQRAARAAQFVLAKLRRNGQLLRSYKDGQAKHDAYLDDYAFFTAGLLDLFEATGEPRWLESAIDLDRVLERHYDDSKAGGFFATAADHEQLLAREKPAYDGAEPSGNSVAVANLLRLAEFTSGDRYRRRAERALQAFRNVLARSPVALSEMLLALDFYYDTPKEIVIVTPQSRADAEPLVARLRASFVPNRVLIVAPQSRIPALVKLVPLVEAKIAQKGRATAYVCEKRVCQLPTADPDVFARQVAKVQPLTAGKPPARQ